MQLRILLPFEIFASKADVSRIVAETGDGSFGLLPNRLDCVAALVPGILVYETKENGTVYVAIDEGVMVKAGDDVLVSVRHAIQRQQTFLARDLPDMRVVNHDQVVLPRQRPHGKRLEILQRAALPQHFDARPRAPLPRAGDERIKAPWVIPCHAPQCEGRTRLCDASHIASRPVVDTVCQQT